MKKKERIKQVQEYIIYKKENGLWTDEKPKKETKAERAERLKRNLENSKARKEKKKQDYRNLIERIG
jgi:hypothetical protein